MRPYILYSLLFVLLNLSGCAVFINSHWTHPEGKTSADFQEDSMDCLYQWTQLTPFSDTPYIIPEAHDGPLGFFMINTDMDSDFEAECLEKKGWVRQEPEKK